MREQKIPRRKWTEQEDRYLMQRFSKQPVANSAIKLNRSVSSVKHRASRLGLNHYMDNLGAKTIAKCFNVDYCVVKRWIEKYDLPYEKVKHSKDCRYNIDTIKFWKWAENNKELINWSKYERMSLAPEPEWVRAERFAYKNVNSRKKITKTEIEKVKRMWMKGCSNEEIAEEIKRSIHSVKHIIRKIAKEV